MPYRDPAVAETDIVVIRTGGASVLRAAFDLHVGGTGTGPQRFKTFERAVLEGEKIAHARGVRLFYIDSPNSAPYVLRDYTWTSE
jgi:hypothetical protein